jgi:hypothetical protein
MVLGPVARLDANHPRLEDLVFDIEPMIGCPLFPVGAIRHADRLKRSETSITNPSDTPLSESTKATNPDLIRANVKSSNSSVRPQLTLVLGSSVVHILGTAGRSLLSAIVFLLNVTRSEMIDPVIGS